MHVRPLRLGAVAYHPRVREIWAAFDGWFADRQVPLEVTLFDDYDTQVDALLAGDLHVAWNTNLAYVQTLSATAGAARPLAMRDTDLGWAAHLVVLRDSPARSVGDLAGARVGFGDADSPQAHLLPVHALCEQGHDPRTTFSASRLDRDLGKHGDTGGAELAQLARLRTGELDACVVSSVTLHTVDGLTGGDGAVRPVWTSPTFSHCNFTVVDADPRHDAFVAALLAMDAGDPRLCEPMQMEYVNRWIVSDGSGYEDLVAAVAAGPVVVGGPAFTTTTAGSAA